MDWASNSNTILFVLQLYIFFTFYRCLVLVEVVCPCPVFMYLVLDICSVRLYRLLRCMWWLFYNINRETLFLSLIGFLKWRWLYKYQRRERYRGGRRIAPSQFSDLLFFWPRYNFLQINFGIYNSWKPRNLESLCHWLQARMS